MESFLHGLKALVIVVLSFQLVACGTILYPERRGQRGGRLDIGIVLLDGIGLLFFIIPGVIAYAVDFTNGTIYLSGARTTMMKSGLDRRDLKTVRFDPKNYTPELLQDTIRRETGYDLDWRDPRLQVIKLQTEDEIPVYFSRTGQTAPESNGMMGSVPKKTTG